MNSDWLETTNVGGDWKGLYQHRETTRLSTTLSTASQSHIYEQL